MSKSNEAKEMVRTARELGHVFIADIHEEDWPYKVSLSLNWNGHDYVLYWEENGHSYEESVKKRDAVKYIVGILEEENER